LAAIAAIGLPGGLIDLQAPRAFDWREWLPVAAAAVMVPALAEEFAFRGALPQLFRPPPHQGEVSPRMRGRRGSDDGGDPHRPAPPGTSPLWGSGRLRADALALLAFIAWHPAQVALGLPFAQAALLRWDFLAIAGLLGLACTISYRRSGSLHPAIAMHWAVVAGWQALAG
jgi:predicted Abi (CAAX) family protease